MPPVSASGRVSGSLVRTASVVGLRCVSAEITLTTSEHPGQAGTLRGSTKEVSVAVGRLVGKGFPKLVG